MRTVHNPDRFMADLRHILSQGRKRIGLLVGAGAPMAIRCNEQGLSDPSGAPLIPGVESLTAQVIEGLAEPFKAAAIKIAGDLGSNGNIEAILSQVRLLEKALGDIQVCGLDSSGYRELAEQICVAIGRIVAVQSPGFRTPYDELISWITGTQRAHPVEIFTTNYDLLLEEAFERTRSAYFDGFSGGATPFFDPVTVAGDDLPARWSKLWKLHGSIGWAIDGSVVTRGHGRDATQLIYPDHLKYDLTKKQPYSALFERLKNFLLFPDTLLLVIGFSFRDAHICAVLEESLSMNANSAAFAFQFQNLANEEAARAMAYTRPNLSIYAADGAVIRGVEGSWQSGDPEKNWAEIRGTFWGQRPDSENPVFLLGDFSQFAVFCAQSQASDLALPLVDPVTLVAEATSGDGQDSTGPISTAT